MMAKHRKWDDDLIDVGEAFLGILVGLEYELQAVKDRLGGLVDLYEAYAVEQELTGQKVILVVHRTWGQVLFLLDLLPVVDLALVYDSAWVQAK